MSLRSLHLWVGGALLDQELQELVKQAQLVALLDFIAQLAHRQKAADLHDR